MGSKACALKQMLANHEARGERTVVFGGAGMQKVQESILSSGIRCRMVSGTSRQCKKTFGWFDRQRTGALFIPFDKTAGVKLQNVSHVVFLHPPLGTCANKKQEEHRALACVGRGNNDHTLAVHRLVALDTLEMVITGQATRPIT